MDPAALKQSFWSLVRRGKKRKAKKEEKEVGIWQVSEI